MTKTASNGLKTGFVIVSIVAGLATTVFWGGARIGRAEQAVTEARAEGKALAIQQKLHEEMLATIRAEQAYQKGVVNTKLDNLQGNIDRILEFISNLEMADGKS